MILFKKTSFSIEALFARKNMLVKDWQFTFIKKPVDRNSVHTNGILKRTDNGLRNEDVIFINSNITSYSNSFVNVLIGIITDSANLKDRLILRLNNSQIHPSSPLCLKFSLFAIF